MSDTALAKILSRLAEAEAAIAMVEHTVNVISDSHRPPDHKPALMDERRPRDPRRIRAGLTRGPPPLDDDDRFLPTTETAQRYATTTRSIDRWAADPKLNFPKPTYINGRKFWSLRALRRWDHERTRGSHWRLRHANGALVIAASTPSCPRSLRNLAADLRRVELRPARNAVQGDAHV